MLPPPKAERGYKPGVNKTTIRIIATQRNSANPRVEEGCRKGGVVGWVDCDDCGVVFASGRKQEKEREGASGGLVDGQPPLATGCGGQN